MNLLDAAYQVLRQGSEVIFIFQTGLTEGNLSFDPVRPVILSRIKQNLQVLIKYKIQENDKKPFGFILCVLDNAEHVELVQLEQNDRWISKKLIKFPLKQIIKATFHTPVRKAHKQLASGDVLGGI